MLLKLRVVSFKNRFRLVGIVLAAAACLNCTFLSAQSIEQPLIEEFEVLGGIQLSNPFTPGISTESYKIKLGPCFNLGAVHRFSERLAASLSIQYESKGLRFESHQFTSDTPPAEVRATQKLTMNYATASLCVKWYPMVRLPLYAGAGPYFAYVVRERAYGEVYINGQPYLTSTHKPPSDYYKDAELGLTGTLGYEFSIGSKLKLTSRAIYSLAFQSFVDKGGTIEYTNNSLSIQLGVLIPRFIRLKFK
jgi:hypothetical protein